MDQRSLSHGLIREDRKKKKATTTEKEKRGGKEHENCASTLPHANS